MKITDKYRKLFEKTIVRIKVESIDINWSIPYQLGEIGAGQGSGFFISDRHIVTCSHVVDSAKNVYIEIPSLGSNKIDVKVLYICPRFDVALLETVDYKSKYKLDLGDSDNIKMGDDILVVGYPVSMTLEGVNENYNLKYTSGVISGTQLSLFQVSANINPGVSGSPLIYNGKVIGINNQKMVGDEIEGVGYSIPINHFKITKKDYDSMKTKKRLINRPAFLFEFSNMNNSMLQFENMSKNDSGIIVTNIYDESPLKKTNIKEGDVITKIDNYKVDNFGTVEKKWFGINQDIYNFLNQYSVNASFPIEYIHNGKKNIDTIHLKEFTTPIRIKYPVYEDVDYIVLGGMIFMNLAVNHLKEDKSMLLKYLGSDEQIKPKIVISMIFPNTPAYILNNLHKDDIITKVNDIDIKYIKDFDRILKKPIIKNDEEYIKFENEKKEIMLIKIDDLIEQDKMFSEIYKYELTPFHLLHLKLKNKLYYKYLED